MKKAVLGFTAAVLFLTFAAPAGAEVVNWIVAQVGDYAITRYDVDRMEEYLQTVGMVDADEDYALQSLIKAYAFMSYAESDDDDELEVNTEEIELYMDSITNMEGTDEMDEELVAYYSEIISTYADEFMLQNTYDQLQTLLVYYDDDLNEASTAAVTDEELYEYYLENTNSMSETLFDAIVLAFDEPDVSTISAYSAFEDKLSAIKSRLAWSDDADYIIDTYTSLDFEDYSGRTGETDVYTLYADGYPELILNILFGYYGESFQMPSGDWVTMKVGKVITFPPVYGITTTGNSMYLIIKFISYDEDAVPEFEDVADTLESYYLEARSDELVEAYLADLIDDGTIDVYILDEDKEGVLDEFLGR